MKTWNQLVARGRKLVENISNSKWELGDLALEIAPVSKTKANSGAYAKLDEYADEIGLSHDQLRSYREVAAAWPHPTRVGSASWTCHRVAMSDKAVLKRLAKKGPVTVAALNEAMGKKAWPNHVPSKPEERAALAKSLLSDEDTATRVYRDEGARASLHRAASRVNRERTFDQMEKDAEREKVVGSYTKEYDGIISFLEATGSFAQARHALVKVINGLQQERFILSQEEMEILGGEVESIKLLTGWLEAWLGGSTKGDWDAALTSLLADYGQEES